MATVITFLLDKSGSMESIKASTIEAYNAYLDGLKNGAGEDEVFSLVQFDSMGLEKSHVNKPVKEVPSLTDATYLPRVGNFVIVDDGGRVTASFKATEGGRLVEVIGPEHPVPTLADAVAVCEQFYERLVN